MTTETVTETGPDERPFTDSMEIEQPQPVTDVEQQPVTDPYSERVRQRLYAHVMRLVGFLQNIARWLIRVDADKEGQELFNELTLSNLKQQQKLTRGLRADLNVLVSAFNQQADIQMAEQKIVRDIAGRLAWYETHVESIRYQRPRYDASEARKKVASEAAAQLAAPIVEQLPLISQPFDINGVKADVVIDARSEP